MSPISLLFATIGMFTPLAEAGGPECLTPTVLDLRGGRALATHPFMVESPPYLGFPPAVRPGPPVAKEVYGGAYEFSIETENFLVTWWDPTIDPAAGEAAAEALESAWQAFVVEQGWPQPVSSDRYLLWVLLDPELSGTGYTAEYFTDEYPEGYPVMWLEPSWAVQPDFWAALAAHEFMHTIQYGMRNPDPGGAGEPWYWEASATWSSQLAFPDNEGFQYASEWYASAPELRFDTVNAGHEYGLFVLNAHLDENSPGTMQAVWNLAAERPGVAWDELLAAATGQDAGQVWGEFTGRYGNRLLANSRLYTDPRLDGPASDGATGNLDKLASTFLEVQEEGRIRVEGPAILGASDGAGTEVNVSPGQILSVTATEDAAVWTLSLLPPLTEDTGGEHGGGEEGGEQDQEEVESNPGPEGEVSKGPENSCAHTRAPVSALMALGLALLAFRRSRP
jgi:hypothetical protein